MAIRSVPLADFSGGLRDAAAPQDFGEAEWARLFGVVVGPERTLGAQWALHTLDGRLVSDWGLFDGVVVYRVETEEGPVWFGGGLPRDTDPNPALDAPSFTELSFILDDPVRGVLDESILGAAPGQEAD